MQLCGIFADVCGVSYARLRPAALPLLADIVTSTSSSPTEDVEMLDDAAEVQFGSTQWTLLYVALVSLTKVQLLPACIPLIV